MQRRLGNDKTENKKKNLKYLFTFRNSNRFYSTAYEVVASNYNEARKELEKVFNNDVSSDVHIQYIKPITK